MPQLTKRRDQILRFIQNFCQGKGYSPSIREIMQGCRISSSALVQYHLQVLEREGKITHEPDVPRSITLVEDNRQTVKIPLLGYIAAGEPLPVLQSDSWSNEVLDILEIPSSLIGKKKSIFALKVKGGSMIDALIDDNDIVVMQSTKIAENGQMVAVWFRKGKEVTLKRFYQEKSRIRLQPANPQMKPLYPDPENIEIQGRVIGVFRRL